MNPTISQRELAKLWGCSQPYIAKLVKRGMPMSSIAQAEEWRALNGERGFVPETTGANAPIPVKSAPFAPPPDVVKEETEYLNRLDDAYLDFRISVNSRGDNYGELLDLLDVQAEVIRRICRLTGLQLEE